MNKAVAILRILAIILIPVGLVLLVFFRLAGLLCTVLVSIAAAYLFNKPLEALEKRMKRPAALLVVFGSLIILVVLFLSYLVPMFVNQTAELLTYVPKLLQAAGGLVDSFGRSAGEPLNGILSQTFEGFQKQAAAWLGGATLRLAQNGSSSLGWALLVPVFMFYFMKDHEYFIDQFHYLIPIRFREDLHAMYLSIDKAVGNFIRGQLLVSLTVALMTSAGLLIIGVPSAPLLGVICGLCNLIPYVGPFIGAVPVALIASMMGWKPMLLAVLVILVVQQLDNMIISPKIIGDSIRIHPVYIIIAIIAGSSLFGMIGLLLALPALIILKEVTLFLFRKSIRKGKTG